MNMHYQIKGTKYVRDLSNMAVLCGDTSEVRRYNTEMRKMQQEQQRDLEINNLKNEVAEIKALIKQLIERG
jgi:hypothetical protein